MRFHAKHGNKGKPAKQNKFRMMSPEFHMYFYDIKYKINYKSTRLPHLGQNLLFGYILLSHFLQKITPF